MSGPVRRATWPEVSNDSGKQARSGARIGVPCLQMCINDEDQEIYLQAGGNLTRDGIATWTNKEEAITFLDDLQAKLEHWGVCIESYQNSGNKHLETLCRRGTSLISKIAQCLQILPPGLTITDITLDKQLASGGFTDVYQGRQSGELVVVKKLRVFQQDAMWDEFYSNLIQESALWRQMKHPHILPFLGINTDIFPGVLCLVSPWMTHGDVHKYLRDIPATQPTINRLAGEIADGLAYLHSLSLVHGDLRGSNVFVDEHENARLADFGMFNVIGSSATCTCSSNSSAVRWMSPEMLRNPPTYESDIWAYACVLLELHTGNIPYHRIRSETAVVLRIQSGKYPDYPAADDCLLDHIPVDTWSLMERCWHVDGAQRPKAHYLSAHFLHPDITPSSAIDDISAEKGGASPSDRAARLSRGSHDEGFPQYETDTSSRHPSCPLDKEAAHTIAPNTPAQQGESDYIAISDSGGYRAAFPNSSWSLWSCMLSALSLGFSPWRSGPLRHGEYMSPTGDSIRKC